MAAAPILPNPIDSITNSVQARRKLVDALKLDLVGPGEGLGDPGEVLPQSPFRWYLTGFLVPVDAPPDQAGDMDADEEVEDSEADAEDSSLPERGAASKMRRFPSSMGLSLLLPSSATQLTVTTSWGDYKRTKEEGDGEWQRTAREETIPVPLPVSGSPMTTVRVPNTGVKDHCLKIAVSVLEVGTSSPGLHGTRTVSVFLVNHREAQPDIVRDQAFAFQARLEVRADQPFVSRPNIAGHAAEGWDDKVADLQYRETYEFAVGHNVAASGNPQQVFTCWIPEAQVERIAPRVETAVTLEMDALATLVDAADARTKLMPLVTEYKAWIDVQAAQVSSIAGQKRQETAQELLARARVAANRIERGIDLLANPQCFKAFRWANEVMATQQRRRNGPVSNKPIESVPTPRWRPFQLAFLLMNLSGIADPHDPDREAVDLLFFPTGGGKTEAYLGLAAFTLLMRRLRNPGLTGAGLCVLMRYTLRLLTLDQLGRGTTLICALELLREREAELGEWPFEIGLWVGVGATPNRMGEVGDNNPDSARAKTIAYKNNTTRTPPIPIENCPWCGSELDKNSFQLKPNQRQPFDLEIWCVNRDCDFSRNRKLPLLAVDEQIFRRLPCFMIATVDKFANMPWVGHTANFFGHVTRHDGWGFYGPADPLARGEMIPGGQLPPPELIIQDELHLISGPLGTMTGLYETAIDALCARDGVHPKIIASTATVRRAESQIRALFDRGQVDVFPPPGPDRRDSFFAETKAPDDDDLTSSARLYTGIAAQGRSAKVCMLRVFLVLLASGQKLYVQGPNDASNPMDPYMTLVAYFNALRELGGARRIIEDEVRRRLMRFTDRKRTGEAAGLFLDRTIRLEPVELTSRIDTAKVAEFKRELELPFSESKHVDVAIATNMISVGLDIGRLGLMVVNGQPKTSSEYIQATSRVGRIPEKPGLVVTILNVHKPRDRSHYERFCVYHETFYRSVEATSVTPFSLRALDRGLAGAAVSLVRLGVPSMTPPNGAMQISAERNHLDFVVRAFGERAAAHSLDLSDTERQILRARVERSVSSLLDRWSRTRQELQAPLQYQPHEGGNGQALLRMFLDPELRNIGRNDWRMRFRANRSMRDVEPSIGIFVRKLSRPNEDLE